MNRSFASRRSPRTIALVGKYHSLEIDQSLRRLAEYLHERGVSVFIERETSEHKMGELFKVIALGKQLNEIPIGFTRGSLLHLL